MEHYFRAKQLSEIFGHERKWAGRIFAELKSNPTAVKRYRNVAVTLSSPGGTLYCYEAIKDYMKNRVALQNVNLARRLAPYGGD